MLQIDLILFKLIYIMRDLYILSINNGLKIIYTNDNNVIDHNQKGINDPKDHV